MRAPEGAFLHGQQLLAAIAGVAKARVWAYRLSFAHQSSIGTNLLARSGIRPGRGGHLRE